MRYDFDITYTPGKNLVTANVLSRQPLGHQDPNLEQDLQLHVNHIISFLPTSATRLQDVLNAQQSNTTILQVVAYTTSM
jgi:hypothetical protein